jgi:hypothetical protein
VGESEEVGSRGYGSISFSVFSSSFANAIDVGSGGMIIDGGGMTFDQDGARPRDSETSDQVPQMIRPGRAEPGKAEAGASDQTLDGERNGSSSNSQGLADSRKTRKTLTVLDKFPENFHGITVHSATTAQFLGTVDRRNLLRVLDRQFQFGPEKKSDSYKRRWHPLKTTNREKDRALFLVGVRSL